MAVVMNTGHDRLFDLITLHVVVYLTQTLKIMSEGCVSDPSKVVNFVRIQHGCGVILESLSNIGSDATSCT